MVWVLIYSIVSFPYSEVRFLGFPSASLIITTFDSFYIDPNLLDLTTSFLLKRFIPLDAPLNVSYIFSVAESKSPIPVLNL